jgi:hypothetical protein
MEKKYLFSILSVLLLANFLSGCEGVHRNEDSPPALPQSWVTPGIAKVTGDASQDQPSREVTAMVRSTLQAHTAALEVAGRKAQALAVKTSTANSEKPSDLVPWHLDGIIASFAIDVGGLFGILAVDASPSIKMTWQTKKTASKPETTPGGSSRNLAVHFNGAMSRERIAQILEPTVQSVAATQSVHNISAFRKHLNSEGEKFLSIARVLNTVHAMYGWHIDSYQLLLSFSAAGEVSTTIGAGGTVAIFFDWTVQRGADPGVLTASEIELRKNIEAFVGNISDAMPSSSQELSNIEKAGFELSVFQVGLGIVAGGTVGIASVQGAAVGRIIFKKDTNVIPSNRLTKNKPKPIKILTSNPELDSPYRILLSEIDAGKFRAGIQRAIDMSSFFIVNAAAVDTKNWKCTEIEAGFDMTAIGDVVFMSVGGTALIRLGFERTN